MTRTVLFALSAVFFFAGALLLLFSTGIAHEVLAGIAWIIATIFFCARAVIGSIVRSREEILAQMGANVVTNAE